MKINTLLKNHIATRFLTDPVFTMEMVEAQDPKFLEQFEKDPHSVDPAMYTLYSLLIPEDQKAYYITWTIIDQLEHLKVKKQFTEGVGWHYDWTVFKQVKNCKLTFIFPNNALLRIRVSDDMIEFCHLRFKFDPNSNNHGEAAWALFYVNRLTGALCDHFKHIDVTSIEQFIYTLLCFFFLTDNDEVVVEPGRKHGTKKSGKLINTLNIPLTVVTSRWNTTVIRREGFTVSGHFKLYWTGPGRTIPRIKLLEPFEKHGYTRRAASESVK